VSDCEGAEDEYDRYALRVVNMLGEGADAHAIARYLTSLVTSSMGTSRKPRRRSSHRGQSRCDPRE
jgi:hypothetical protein